MRARVAIIVFLGLYAPADAVSIAQTATESQSSGADLYRSACAACHGPDGKGASPAVVGFDTPLPDFTDCRFATPEADADWIAVVHQGGSARAFDRMMPAFGEALAERDIAAVVGYLRGFCTESGWPRGELNLPRALVTEKAFPENEALITTTISGAGGTSIGTELLYERRAGRRGQYEIAVPFDVRRTGEANWQRAIGDIAIAYKHVLAHSLARGSILSAGSEIVFPTGDESAGLGDGDTILEPFGTFSQVLPANGFLHAHTGLVLPLGAGDARTGAFWRIAAGRTFIERRWHRAWSPLIELLGSRETAERIPIAWDILPQLQVSLSRRQHVLLNAGLRVPVTDRRARGKAAMVYLLWDWFDGGLFSGW